jgi:hypothetical protein
LAECDAESESSLDDYDAESGSSLDDSDAEWGSSLDDRDTGCAASSIESSEFSTDDEESNVKAELKCNLLRLQQQILRLKKEKKR